MCKLNTGRVRLSVITVNLTNGLLGITRVTPFLNTLRPFRNSRHFADDIFKCIFLNENVWIPLKISMTFVPMSPINNIPTLVQVMAWRRPGDKPLSEPMTVNSSTHKCATRPQCVKYGKHSTGLSTYGPWVRIYTGACSPASPFLRFIVTEPSRKKPVRTEGCHVGLFRKCVATACCTCGQ